MTDTDRKALNEGIAELEAKNEKLEEALDKSIILGIDTGDPTILHKSGGTIGNMFLEDVEAHNARIDALLDDERD